MDGFAKACASIGENSRLSRPAIGVCGGDTPQTAERRGGGAWRSFGGGQDNTKGLLPVGCNNLPIHVEHIFVKS